MLKSLVLYPFWGNGLCVYEWYEEDNFTIYAIVYALFVYAIIIYKTRYELLFPAPLSEPFVWQNGKLVVYDVLDVYVQ